MTPPASPDWQVLYLLSTVAAMFLHAGLAVFVWRFRNQTPGTTFMFVSICALGWSVLVFLMAVLPPTVTALLINIKYLFIQFAPVALFLFVLEVTGQTPRRRRLLVASLTVIPVLTLAVLWNGATNDWILREPRFARVGVLTYVEQLSYGPFYWLGAVQGYLLTLLAIGLLLASAYRANRLVRSQALLLMFGFLAPLIAQVLLVTRIMPRAYDPMPHGLAIAGVMFWWAALRHQLFDLVPMARNVLVDALSDSVLAVDSQDRIIDLNASMANLMGVTTRAVLGRPLARLFDGLPASGATVMQAGRQFAARVVPLPARGGSPSGRLLVLQDITQRLAADAERERLIVELSDALTQVKTLRGLLAMCASCKQIKDKAGVWRPVDEYITENSEANLSHGVCPDCRNRLYPGIYSGGGA